MDARRGARVLTLVLALLGMTQTALAQDTAAAAPPAAPSVVSASTLARIKAAVASEPAVTLDDDALRFYVQITATPMTFADYLRGSGAWFEVAPTSAPARLPGGARAPPAGGLDLLSLFRRANKAVQDRKARQIRAQIDRELEALEAAKTGGGTAP
jgi:hypothetical protein